MKVVGGKAMSQYKKGGRKIGVKKNKLYIGGGGGFSKPKSTQRKGKISKVLGKTLSKAGQIAKSSAKTAVKKAVIAGGKKLVEQGNKKANTAIRTTALSASIASGNPLPFVGGEALILGKDLLLKKGVKLAEKKINQLGEEKGKKVPSKGTSEVPRRMYTRPIPTPRYRLPPPPPTNRRNIGKYGSSAPRPTGSRM